jgi:PAS domain S-box-containing protein
MFDKLFERSADAIWLLDPDNVVFAECNQAAVKLMRARVTAQLVGVRPDELSPPIQPDGQSSSAKAAALGALTDQAGAHCFEWVARRRDGTEIPLEVMVTPLSAEGRRLNVVVARDISARKQAEVALRESEQKFRQLFEATTDAIQILDPLL